MRRRGAERAGGELPLVTTWSPSLPLLPFAKAGFLKALDGSLLSVAR